MLIFEEMKLYETNINGIKIYSDKYNVIITSENKLECLSNAAINGGRVMSDSIVNHHVPLDFNHTNLEKTLSSVKNKYNLSDSMIGLLTAVDMDDIIILNESVDNINYIIALTAGISNACSPEDQDNNLFFNSTKLGTINIILIIEGRLSAHAFVNLIIIITEAKTLILNKFDVRTKNGSLATGTSTDTIVVASTGTGKEIIWSGYATKFGQSVGHSVITVLETAFKEKMNLKPTV